MTEQKKPAPAASKPAAAPKPAATGGCCSGGAKPKPAGPQTGKK